MSGALSLLFNGLARACAKAERTARRLEVSLRSDARTPHEASVIDSTLRYDMASEPDEAYYRDLYWGWMAPYLAGQPHDARCLDLGCGQGRFTMPLAARFPAGEVTGVDLSQPALDRAAASADHAKLTNVKWVRAPLDQVAATLEPRSYDVIVFTEVSFFWPDWAMHFPRMAAAIRPGGLVIASFRSQYFDALCVAQNRLWDKVEMVLAQRRGQVFGGATEFSWQRSNEIGALMNADASLELQLLAGVGVCSGIEGDPHATVARPSTLDEGERTRLMALERAMGPLVPDAGRYVLAIARKTADKAAS